ncbi:MAG: DUF1318 domain-containing protein [Alphaproteobacteria bacterium]|nr:DUF1318 domain-containing protein [Alphaproteobacteria bacterium]
MKSRFLIAVAAAVLMVSPAFALDLHSARAQGLVGEQNTGYAKALKPEAASLVAEVNAKRKAEYAKISAQNGQSVDVVAKLAAGQIAGSLESGNSYQDASGNWVKK